MADAAAAPADVSSTNKVEEQKQTLAMIAEPAIAEAKPAEDGVLATSGVAQVSETNTTEDYKVTTENGSSTTPTDKEAASNDADAATADANGTPAKKGVAAKRKSLSGVPEHRKKTPAKGKKKAPELRLDVSAGDMFMVAMRGYQPWPVIVCDEEMLPESLLSKRPVSARRIDGTYREDFLESGKNAKDRRYPIMFLGTNEFAWQVNTELFTFDLDEVKKDVEASNQGKKNKALWEAYQIAAEGHDLAHFKQMLTQHEQALQEDLEQKEQKEQEKKEKADKAAKRKSVVAVLNDVDMDDAEGPTSSKKAKGAKKRKKGEESEDESEKPAKTPKTKLKLTTKTLKDASAAKPASGIRSKKKASEEEEVVAPGEPSMTEEERSQKREKQVLYLRHRLQKGFLSRDQAPRDEDMVNMSEYLKQLEIHDDLEAEVIKRTKVHKVLKAIIKLDFIPKEEEHRFKRRSNELLTKWNRALAADSSEPPTAASAAAPSINGVKDDGTRSEDLKEDSIEKKPAEVLSPGGLIVPKLVDQDGDVAMSGEDKADGKDVSTTKAAEPLVPASGPTAA